MALKHLVRDVLRDQDSAQFSNTVLYLNEPDADGLGGLYTMCGTVNAKNGFGGYVGDTSFVSTMYAKNDNGALKYNRDQVYFANQESAGAYDEAYARLCHDKTAVSSGSTTPSPALAAVPKTSNAPVISYAVIASKQTTLDVPWAYAIVKHAPSNQQPIDLAFELHRRFPDTRFTILDDSSRVKELDLDFDSGTERVPQTWSNAHDFAMLNTFFVDGKKKWRLVGDDANTTMSGKIITDLE